MAYYPNDFPSNGNAHHHPPNRRPYIRITLEDGRVVDGKAHVWEGDRILATWYEDRIQHDLWMDAVHAVKITRRESTWKDSPSVDDIPWRAEQGEL